MGLGFTPRTVISKPLPVTVSSYHITAPWGTQEVAPSCGPSKVRQLLRKGQAGQEPRFFLFCPTPQVDQTPNSASNPLQDEVMGK